MRKRQPKLALRNRTTNNAGARMGRHVCFCGAPQVNRKIRTRSLTGGSKASGLAAVNEAGTRMGRHVCFWLLAATSQPQRANKEFHRRFKSSKTPPMGPLPDPISPAVWMETRLLQRPRPRQPRLLKRPPPLLRQQLQPPEPRMHTHLGLSPAMVLRSVPAN